MAASANVVVAFGSSEATASGEFVLTIEENAEDNKKPTTTFTENRQEQADCTTLRDIIGLDPLESLNFNEEGDNNLGVGSDISSQIQECLLNMKSWSTKKLRMYPNVPATLRGVNCSVFMSGTGEETFTESVAVTGSKTVGLRYPAKNVSIGAFEGFDKQGNRVNPSFVFDGDKSLLTSTECYGLVDVTYTVEYRILRMVVEPTGSKVRALVQAIHEETESVAVYATEYEVERCEYNDLMTSGCVGLGDLFNTTQWFPTMLDTTVENNYNNETQYINNYEDELDDLNGANIWREIDREEEEINVGGAEIARMTKVTMQAGTRTVTMTFTNPTS